MTPIERSQIDAVAKLLGRALVLDSPPGVGEPDGVSEAQATAAAVIVDPLLVATNQGTAGDALATGEPGQIAAAAGRALAQVLQIDLGGERPPADLARIGYEAYAKATGGLTFDGRRMPSWGEIVTRDRERGTKVSAAWAAAALAIRGER